MSSRSFSEEIASYMDKMLGDYARYLSQHPEKANEYATNTEHTEITATIDTHSTESTQYTDNTAHTTPQTAVPVDTQPVAIPTAVEESIAVSQMKFIPAQAQPVAPPKQESTKQELTPAEHYDIFKNANMYRGYMRIQTLMARGTLPVSGATITVSKDFPSGEHIISKMVTDTSGQTQVIELPAPSAELSQTPQDKKPYATYKILVEEKNSVSVINRAAPVFADTLSLQIVEMIQNSASGDMEIIDVTSEEYRDLYNTRERQQED